MRIKSAIKHAEKILAFTKKVSEDKKAMYNGTKEQLSELAELCEKIQGEISDILGSAKPRGVTVNCPIADNNMFNALWEKVDSLERLVRENSSSEKEEQMPAETTDVKSHSDTNTEEKLPDTEKSQIRNNKDFVSPKEAKNVLHAYSAVFEKTAKQKHDLETINVCSDLIWRWFYKRFICKPNGFRKLRFNILHIQKYLAAIVVYLGYYIEKGELDKAVDAMNTWIDAIGVDKKITENYIVPYECLQIYRLEANNHANVTAMLIWNELYKLGYSEFKSVKLESGKWVSRLSRIVYNLVAEMEEAVGDKKGINTSIYPKIADKPELLWQYNIV